MNRLFVGSLLLFAAGRAHAQNPPPDELPKYGLYLHFGLSTFSGYDRKSKDMGRVPPEKFAPTEIDARGWARTAKQAGMDYAVLTVKHEDGFCLWPAKDCDYHIGHSPVKSDIVGDYIAACNAEGITPGVHYSIMDAYSEGSVGLKGPLSPGYFETVKGHIRDLHTKYPGIRIQIFDGASRLTPQQFNTLRKIIKQLNPSCIVNAGKAYGSGTVNKHWFWSQDAQLNSSQQLVEQYSKSAAEGKPFLVGVGVDKTGHIPDAYVAVLMEMKALIAQPARVSVRFIELKMDASGNGSLHIDCRTNSETRITRAQGVSSKLASLDGATILRLKDGQTEVLHDFATFTNIEDLVSNTQTKDAFALDKERSGLLIKPIGMPGEKRKWATFWYPRPAQLPVTLRMEVADLESNPFCFELQFNQKKYAKLNVYFFTDAKKPRAVEVSWFNAEKGNNALFLINSDLPVDGDVTYTFKCPIDPEHQYPTPQFARGNSEMMIRKLEVTARFPARIGVTFADRKGQVVVGSVLEGSASKAGVRPGDVVSQIGDKPIENAEAAVQIIRDRNPGDTLKLTISREGKKLTIPVIAE